MSIQSGPFPADSALCDRPLVLKSQEKSTCGTRPRLFRPLSAGRSLQGNSTIASPVATFSPAWFFTITSITTQRDLAVACFDLTIPVG
jgi:hypothetical protein